MTANKFASVFADELAQYIDLKVSLGFKEKSFRILRTFDKFCSSIQLDQKIFSVENGELWIERRPSEATTTHYNRVNVTNHFLYYLVLKGYDVVIPSEVSYKPTSFKPHIYTEDEIERYFNSVDTYVNSNAPKRNIQVPIIFRILYCCGPRISEVLSIKKKNVDLEKGLIKLTTTKNQEERYLVLSDELNDLMKQYANKCFYLIRDDDYIFTRKNNQPLTSKDIYEIHRMILQHAGIPYVGDGEGPRVHDWRHTFAVRAFKQLNDAGVDLYASLPVISVYLGHKTIFATEKYLRLTMEIYPEISKKLEGTVAYLLEDEENEDY